MTDINALAKALQGAIGENAQEDEVKNWLNTGYGPLNHILTGDYAKGWPYGRIIEIFGPAASGKTLIATLAMIAAQKAGGICCFIDWERSFNAEFARSFGLNTEFPHFVYHRPKTWEEGNTIAMKFGETIRKQKLLPEDAPIVAVLDSIAAAVPKSVFYDSKGKERGIDELTMNDTTALARVSSTTLKSINQFVGDFNMTAIYLNQIRMKPGVVYGDPTTTPGGQSMEFYASIRVATGAKKIMEEQGGAKEFTGRLIGVETKKNKLSKPFQSVDLRLTYGDDGKCSFDFTLSLIEHLVELGKLPVPSKGFVEWDGKRYTKKQLAAKVDSEGAQQVLNDLLLK